MICLKVLLALRLVLALNIFVEVSVAYLPC